MLREAVSAFGIYGVVDTLADQRPSMDEELSVALASLWLEPMEAPDEAKAAGIPTG